MSSSVYDHTEGFTLEYLTTLRGQLMELHTVLQDKLHTGRRQEREHYQTAAPPFSPQPPNKGGGVVYDEDWNRVMKVLEAVFMHNRSLMVDVQLPLEELLHGFEMRLFKSKQHTNTQQTATLIVLDTAADKLDVMASHCLMGLTDPFGQLPVFTVDARTRGTTAQPDDMQRQQAFTWLLYGTYQHAWRKCVTEITNAVMAMQSFIHFLTVYAGDLASAS